MRKISVGYQEFPKAAAAKLLIHHGPSLKIHVGFDATWKPTANKPPKPDDHDLEALIDTGARHSCIDGDLAGRLRLPHHDRKWVSTCNGKLLTDFYMAQIHVPSLRFTQRGSFAAVPLVASGFAYQVILGRSFLSYLKFEYDGTTGEIVITFPEPKEDSLAD